MNLKINSAIHPRRRTSLPSHLKLYETWTGVNNEECDDNSKFDVDYIPPDSSDKAKNTFTADSHHTSHSSDIENVKNREQDNLVNATSGYQEETGDNTMVVKATKMHTCSHCGASFNLKGELKVHLNTHTGLKPFECEICKKGFRSKDSILRHQLTHTGAKPFPCDICNQGFSSAVALKEHQARHNNLKLYECNICGREFRQNSCYRRHLATHSKEASYLCEICSRRFTQASYLRSHLLVHTGERPHSCQKCGKAFAHLSDLNRHKVTHTGNRPYKCDMCNAAFADRSSRKRHQKEHTNKSRMFVCHLCGVSFKQAKHAENHIKRKHSSAEVSNTTNPVVESNDSHTQVNKEHLDNPLTGTPEETINDISVTPGIQSVNVNSTTLLISPSLAESNYSEPPSSQNDFQPNFCVNSDKNNAVKDVEVKDGFTVSHQEINFQTSLPNQQTYNSTSNLQEILAFPPQMNYVAYPDFSSQDYYNWLSNFTSFCKLLPVPIETELVTKITQVHKSIADVLASPTGVLSTKENFKILMSIAQDLNLIINNQLAYMLDHLQS